jgi:hypothetical protein
MASQGSSSRKSMSYSSFQGRKKANENGGGGLDGSRRSLTSSRSMYVRSEFLFLFIYMFDSENHFYFYFLI